MEIPTQYYVYEFSYPEGMSELAGVVFYVGKSISANRMDTHLNEARGGCTCKKCKAIRSIWEADLTVTRRIVFETSSEEDVVNEERRRILQHQSPHLTNMIRTEKMYKKPAQPAQTTWEPNEEPQPEVVFLGTATYNLAPGEEIRSASDLARSSLRSLLKVGLRRGVIPYSPQVTDLLLSDWPNNKK